jgi:hypothetical protein
MVVSNTISVKNFIIIVQSIGERVFACQGKSAVIGNA